MRSDERFLVTGAMGCIGSWVVAQLVREGVSVTTFDLSEDDARWQLLMDPDERESVNRVVGDLTDPTAVADVIADGQITHIVHLGGLQFPFCRANPVLGAQVNVLGTVNVFAGAQAAQHVRGLSYASSVAVFGPAADYPDRTVADDSPLDPRSFYGTYKQANEFTARAFWADQGVGSVGLRPPIVYGMGRDQGITADPSLAMRAAATGQSFDIKFGGTIALGYAGDVAADFITSARAEVDGALVHNNRARSHTVDEVISAIDNAVGVKGLISRGEATAETVEHVDDQSVEYLLSEAELTTLIEGVQESVAGFRRTADSA
ncbi:NAD-dependent epimerase/dehydratase family protein [Demetria terragena]|uniref:NAD-dependent epimerase/dehydratase family protein n=1 Tax=Demetria terragena TaxID=63959 RepID=UPI00037F1247|nr:NAD(P)-dependent oxidoreductase [Demetria terragena]